MKERPILFSAPMVRALLDGSKTQTRRVCKPRRDMGIGCDLAPHEIAGEINRGDFTNTVYGAPGDRLWVRESFAHIYRGNAAPAARRPDDVVFMADGLTPDAYVYGSWKPSIHMPRWASRIDLEITGVRVERLHDISEADAQAEGARECDPVSGREVLLAGASQRGSFVLHYRDIWEQINGAGSWPINPWVWVVEFKRKAK